MAPRLSPFEINDATIDDFLNPLQGNIVVLYSWADSMFSNDVLGEVVDQKKTCTCYAHATTGITRAAINIHNNFNDCITTLSAQDVYDNCHGLVTCNGHLTSCAIEYIARNKCALERDVKFNDTEADPTKARLENVERYGVDFWEIIKNNDDDIMAAVLDGPLAIDIPWHITLNEYKGGVIDFTKVKDREENIARVNERRREANLPLHPSEIVPHSVILTGFGVLKLKRDVEIDIWEAKNSVGEVIGPEWRKGYIYFLRNSSLSSNKWLPLNPVAAKMYGKVYENGHCSTPAKVEEVTLSAFYYWASNTDFDFIVLFYDRSCESLEELKKIYEGRARLYFWDLIDTKTLSIDVTDQWDQAHEWFGVDNNKNGVLLTYKHHSDDYGNAGVARDLKSEAEKLTLDGLHTTW